MNCRKAQRHMSAYLDGELVGASRDAFFDHLHGCAACADALGEAAFREIAVSTSFARHMEAPAAIRHNVMNAIAGRKARATSPLRPGFAWRPAVAFATVLALLGVGLQALRDVGQPLPEVVAVESRPSRATEPAVSAPTSAPREPAHRVADARRAEGKPAPAHAPRPAPRARVQTRPNVSPAPAVARPAPPRVEPPRGQPPAPTRIAENAPDQAIGTVSYVWTPDNVMNGRFLSRRHLDREWSEASYDLDISTHMQTTESTVIETALKDGTHLKINESTEFVILRAPTKENASWSIRLMHGEVWVRGMPGVPVEIVTPSMTVRGADAEFSVRSFDGEDAAALVVSGEVVCENAKGMVKATEGHAVGVEASRAPGEPFVAAELIGHLEWAYRAKQAYNALNHGAYPM